MDLHQAGVDELWVEQLPAAITLLLFARFGILEGEEDVLTVELLDPDLALVGVLDLPMVGNPPPHHREGHEIVLMQPIEVTFEAEKEGIYVAEIRTDTGLVDPLFAGVRVGEPPY